MSKNFHKDIDKENIEIAKSINEDSKNINIPEVKSLDTILNENKNTGNKKKIYSFISAAAAVAVLVVSIPIFNGTRIANQKKPSASPDAISQEGISGVKVASSYEDIYSLVDEQKNKRDSQMIPKSMGYLVEDTEVGEVISSDAVNTSKVEGLGASTSDANHSNTNVQVEGVDEEDIIKTDGEYIYLVKENDYGSKQIVISKTKGKKVEIVNTIKVAENKSSSYVNGLYIYENYLVAIVREYHYDFGTIKYSEDFVDSEKISTNNKDCTHIYVYDITNKSKEKLVSHNTQDGYVVSTRLIGKNLYTVSTKTIDYFTKDHGGIIPCVNDKALECDCIYVPEKSDNLEQFVIATSIDITDSKKIKSSISLMGSASNIFVSNNHMYILENTVEYEDNNEKELKKENIKNFDELKEAYEREYKEKNIRIDTFKVERTSTDCCNITKVDLKDGKVTVKSKNHIEGRVESNLFVNEKDDYLRVVANVNTVTYLEEKHVIYDSNGKELDTRYSYLKYISDSNEKTNSVYVLNDKLETVASIDKIAADEDLYAARYMGDYGYFVTFENTDPLFTVDFSDMENPKIVGELEMPGYSAFLHEYGDGLMFGIGFETIKNNDFIKMEMYNIKNNVAKQKSKLLIGKKSKDYSWAYCAAADGEYKDLLFDPEKNLIGFYYNISAVEEDEIYYYGIYTYENNEFKCIKTIELTEYEDKWPGCVRGMYIDNYFYAIDCSNGIYSLDLNNPDKVEFTSF